MTTANPPSSRRAWITGAGSGIGRALAERLAGRGYQVAASARTREDLDSLAAASAGKIIAFPLDVTDEAAVLATIEQIEMRLGPLDLVVLNAGTYKRVSATNFTTELYREQVEVNLMGTVNCLAGVMPRMIGRHAGHIAVVSSLTGHVGLPSAAAYGATKAALINMCEALHPELEAEGVTLSLINPGFVDTPLTQRNDFPMPFLVSVDDAVDRIVAGLGSRRFEIAFPWRMSFAIRLLALLPHPLRLMVTRRMVRH